MLSSVEYKLYLCFQVVGFNMTRRAVEKLKEQTDYSPQDVQVVKLQDGFSANELIQ